jgi:hypothetical protein
MSRNRVWKKDWLAMTHDMPGKIMIILMFGMCDIESACPDQWLHSWTDTAGGIAESIEPMNDGGMIVAGHKINPVNYESHSWMARLNGQGVIEWSRLFDQWNSSVISSIHQLKNGNIIVLGGFGDSNTFNQISTRLLLAASSGDSIESFSLNISQVVGIHDFQPTSDGGFILAGFTQGWNEQDGYSYNYGKTALVKIDSMGHTQWTRFLGGDSLNYVYSVRQQKDGGFICAGFTSSEGAGRRDVWLVRTNSQGDTLWTRTYGGLVDDCAWNIQNTSDGGFIIAGYTESFGDGLGADVWLLRANASGDTLWTKTFGGDGVDWGKWVFQTPDNGFIIGGFTSSFGAMFSDIYLIRTDARGDSLWTRTIRGNDYLNTPAAFLTADDGLVAAVNKGEIGVSFFKMSCLGNNSIKPRRTNTPALATPGIFVFQSGHGHHIQIRNFRQASPVKNVGLFTIQGRAVKTAIPDASNDGTCSIDIGHVPRGIYLLKFSMENTVFTKSVLIKQ